MAMFDTPTFLRRVLLLDAGVSGVTGLFMWLGAGVLEPLLGLPGALLQVAGISLLPFAAALVLLARRASIPRAAVASVIVANGLWVVASIALAVGRLVPLTDFGYAFVVIQAVAVAGFAELQWMGMRRASGAAVLA
jgi:hypothetical protein